MEDKFKDIKAGDRVLVSVKSNSLYAGRVTFLVGAEVERTTATRFIIEGDQYRKSDGYKIGSESYHGAEVYTKEKDETNEWRAHLRQVSIYVKAIRKLQAIKIPEFAQLTEYKIDIISYRITQLAECIEYI